MNKTDYEDGRSYFTEPGIKRQIAIKVIEAALRNSLHNPVMVTLEAFNVNIVDKESLVDRVPQRMTTLTLKDTGRGMLREVIDNKLLVPSIQEKRSYKKRYWPRDVYHEA